MEDLGFDPTFDPAEWARLCRHHFAARRPLLVGQVWDEIWESVCYSRRVVVVTPKPQSNIGVIVLPDSAQGTRREGWVVAVSPDACVPSHLTGQPAVPFDSPFDLIGRRVYFGTYAGVDVIADAMPRDTPERNLVAGKPGRYRSLMVDDILGESLKSEGSIL